MRHDAYGPTAEDAPFPLTVIGVSVARLEGAGEAATEAARAPETATNAAAFMVFGGGVVE